MSGQYYGGRKPAGAPPRVNSYAWRRRFREQQSLRAAASRALRARGVLPTREAIDKELEEP